MYWLNQNDNGYICVDCDMNRIYFVDLRYPECDSYIIEDLYNDSEDVDTE